MFFSQNLTIPEEEIPHKKNGIFPRLALLLAYVFFFILSRTDSTCQRNASLNTWTGCESGTVFSSLVPQVFNQVRTSWPVRWRPVF